MVTEKQYLEAQKIVTEYNEQIRQLELNRVNLLKIKREEKEKWCEENGGHEYFSSGGKWSSTTQMSCNYCGRTIK